jgi:hypothetical protein
MAIIENGKIYGIPHADIKKQSTSWLKGVRKLLTRIQESGETVPDSEVLWKEVSEELERRLSTATADDDSVTLIEPEKMREGR